MDVGMLLRQARGASHGPAGGRNLISGIITTGRYHVLNE